MLLRVKFGVSWRIWHVSSIWTRTTIDSSSRVRSCSHPNPCFSLILFFSQVCKARPWRRTVVSALGMLGHCLWGLTHAPSPLTLFQHQDRLDEALTALGHSLKLDPNRAYTKAWHQSKGFDWTFWPLLQNEIEVIKDRIKEGKGARKRGHREPGAPENPFTPRHHVLSKHERKHEVKF